MRARSSRLRLGRYSTVGQIYLITTVVRERQPLFSDLRTARLLVHELMRCEEQALVKSLAWVVMPDHFHWLFELQLGSLPGVMQQVKGRSSVVICRATRIVTPLWQRGYHDQAVRSAQDLPALARYIVANPLRAGLVDRIGDYPLWDAIWLD